MHWEKCVFLFFLLSQMQKEKKTVWIISPLSLGSPVEKIQAWGFLWSEQNLHTQISSEGI